jgi:hypothetical protein
MVFLVRAGAVWTSHVHKREEPQARPGDGQPAQAYLSSNSKKGLARPEIGAGGLQMVPESRWFDCIWWGGKVSSNQLAISGGRPGEDDYGDSGLDTAESRMTGI